MLGLLTHWKLIGGAVAGAALAGYIGVLNFNLARERATVALLNNDLAVALGKYETCDNRIRNIMEARRDAETASDPDFTVPDHWLRPDD